MATGWAVIAYNNTMKRFRQAFKDCRAINTFWVDNNKWKFYDVKLPVLLLLCKADGNYIFSHPCPNRRADVGAPGFDVVKWCALQWIEEFERHGLGDPITLYELQDYHVPIREIPGCFTQPFLVERPDGWVLIPKITRGTGIRLFIGNHQVVKRWFPLPYFASEHNPGEYQDRARADDKYKKYVDLHAEIGKIKQSC